MSLITENHSQIRESIKQVIRDSVKRKELIYQESWDIARDEFRKKNSTVNFDNLSASERLKIVEEVQSRFEIIEYAPIEKPAP